MEKQEVMSAYREMQQREEMAEEIDRIIDERGGDGFRLPEDFDPALSSEEEMSMSRRCEALRTELEGRGFRVALDEGMPLKVVALYAEHVELVTEGLRLPLGDNITFTGCGGWCDGCFQAPWCRAKVEMDREGAGEMSR